MDFFAAVLVFSSTPVSMNKYLSKSAGELNLSEVLLLWSGFLLLLHI